MYMELHQRQPRQDQAIFSLLATEPAADSALCFGCLFFHRLVKLVNGAVDLLACLGAHLFSFGFGFSEFGFGFGGLDGS